jgi:hypothetical protein
MTKSKPTNPTNVYIEMQNIVSSYAQVQNNMRYAMKSCEDFANKLQKFQSFVTEDWLKKYQETIRKLDYLSTELLKSCEENDFSLIISEKT